MKTKLQLALCISFAFLIGIFQASALTLKGQVILNGNFVEETKTKNEDAKYEFFKFGPKAQKDDDGLIIEFSDGSYGGRLALWYWFEESINKGKGGESGSTADDASEVSFRRSNLWFKPFTTLKLTIGYVGTDKLYKEKIDEWKVGNPFKYNERDWSAHPGYVNNADVDEMGFGVEVTPMDGLILTGGITRVKGDDYGVAFWTKDGNGDPVYRAWGVSARYYPGNDICFQAAFRDNGTKSWKVARCAAGYEATGILAFVQPCFGIDWNTTNEKYELSGICFDLYGEFNVDAWKFTAHVPVTVRTTGRDDDPSYMEYVLQAKYNFGQVGNMSEFSPYIQVGTMNHDGDQPLAFIKFDDVSNSMNFDVKPGLSFKVATLEFNTGFEMLFHSKNYTDDKNSAGFEWRVPFSAKMKF